MYLRIWQLAWPLILVNVTVPLLGLVDTAVMGHLPSPIYLAALAVSSSLFTLVLWCFGFLRMGTSGFSAQAFGAGDDRLASYLWLQSVSLALLAGALLIFSAGYWIPSGLRWMETPVEALPYAATYSHIRIWAAPITLLNFVLAGWLVGRQAIRAVMALALLTNMLNICLDLLFVPVLGYDIAGVAWATVIAEATACVVGIRLCSRRLPGLASAIRERWLTVAAFQLLLRVNGPLFLRTILLVVTLAFFQAQGASMGVVVVSANAVLLNFVLLVSNALDGFANAVEALSGEALGAGRAESFSQIVRTGLTWALFLALVLTLFFWMAGSAMIHLISDLEGVRRLAHEYLPWLIAVPIVAVWCFLFDGVFIGALRTDMLLKSVLVASLLVFFPVWGATRSLGNHGLWLSLLLFFAARSLFLSASWLRFKPAAPFPAER